VLSGHLGGVRTLASMAGDSPVVVSGSADRTIRVWDVATRESLAPLAASSHQTDGIWAWGESAASVQSVEGAHSAAIRCVRFGNRSGQTGACLRFH
jgi:WD40 repeat protein